MIRCQRALPGRLSVFFCHGRACSSGGSGLGVALPRRERSNSAVCSAVLPPRPLALLPAPAPTAASWMLNGRGRCACWFLRAGQWSKRASPLASELGTYTFIRLWQVLAASHHWWGASCLGGAQRTRDAPALPCTDHQREQAVAGGQGGPRPHLLLGAGKHGQIALLLVDCVVGLCVALCRAAPGRSSALAPRRPLPSSYPPCSPTVYFK